MRRNSYKAIRNRYERENRLAREAAVVPTVGFALMGLLLCGCSGSTPRPTTSVEVSPDAALAGANAVVDCEIAAAGRFDGSGVSTTALAQRVMGVCTPERFRARRAAGIAPLDPSVDAVELQQAVDAVETARKRRKP